MIKLNGVRRDDVPIAEGDAVICPACDGEGKVYTLASEDQDRILVTCDLCQGSGAVVVKHGRYQ